MHRHFALPDDNEKRGTARHQYLCFFAADFPQIAAQGTQYLCGFRASGAESGVSEEK
jgi:hypothetical protein